MRVATHGTLDGNHTATVTGANTLRFTTTNNFAYFAGWGDGEGSFGQYNATGVAVVVNETTGGGGVSSDSGYITDHRPTAVAWYAGRVFYAGAAYAKIADTIFFSQIVEDASQYGLCYQRNDPTADTFNVLLPTDGGTIKIPGLHGVLRMEILGDALIVFSRAGVWEIRGGRGGFSAMDYNVRKITDAECVSAGGVCRTDAGLVFASKRGLYVLGIDTNSGFISSGNVTEARLNTYWSQIPDDNLETIYMVYDDSKKRVYTLISKPNSVAANPSVRGLTEALVLDLKHGEAGAFYRLTLPYGGTGYVIGGLALDSADNPASNKKIKFVWKPTSSAYIRFLDMEHTSFTDEDGEDRPPYYKAAWDAAVPAEGVDGRTTSDWHTRKQAGLYVYMFLGRTETGWTEVNQELYPVNPGSVFIQGRWEWSDSSNSGKWTAPQQAYRPKGLYSPFGGAGEGMQNGAPVIVTRNKIRGSGRSLGLYITGEEGKDAHILGWLIQYGVT
jgi:hypothetical protein